MTTLVWNSWRIFKSRAGFKQFRFPVTASPSSAGISLVYTWCVILNATLKLAPYKNATLEERKWFYFTEGVGTGFPKQFLPMNARRRRFRNTIRRVWGRIRWISSVIRYGRFKNFIFQVSPQEIVERVQIWTVRGGKTLGNEPVTEEPAQHCHRLLRHVWLRTVLLEYAIPFVIFE